MSKSNISEIVNSLLSGVRGISRSETIVGAPQQAGDATVIPVHRLKIAFGAASASAGAHSAHVGGDSGGHGAGGAVELEPVGAIAVGKDGVARLLTVEADSPATWSALVQQAPELIGKLTQALAERVHHELAPRVQAQAISTSASERALPDKDELESER